MTQNIPKIIQPTVGRKVWFWPQGSAFMKDMEQFIPAQLGAQPMDATVVYVWHDRMVNLLVLDHNGNAFSVTSVTLVQECDPLPTGAYCEWMPFQKGQAAKAEAPAAPVVAISSQQRFQLEQQLVFGAAGTLAQAPHSAGDIARGINELLNILHPVSADQPLVLPVVDPAGSAAPAAVAH